MKNTLSKMLPVSAGFLEKLVLKAGVHLKLVFPPLNLVSCEYLVRVSSNPETLCLLHKAICLAMFCKFLGDFGGCLGRDNFSQRISKIWRNKKYLRCNVILKLEFEVKN